MLTGDKLLFDEHSFNMVCLEKTLQIYITLCGSNL